MCTRNSARSQLAAALWRSVISATAESAGRHPADRIDAGALAAARRAKLSILDVAPRSITEVTPIPPIVVTVCDQAHEELDPPYDWIHWSVPDPVSIGTPAAFYMTVARLRERVAGQRVAWRRRRVALLTVATPDDHVRKAPLAGPHEITPGGGGEAPAAVVACEAGRPFPPRSFTSSVARTARSGRLMFFCASPRRRLRDRPHS